MLVIAHRGACQEAPENSFAAFESAIDAGATRIELDVQVSKDDHLVIMHDDRLDRTTNTTGLISAMTRRELEKVRLVNGEQLPFLDEVLTRFLPRIELNIELKPADERAAIITARALEPFTHLWSKVIVSSFKYRPLTFLQREYPALQLACLWCWDIDWPYLMSASPLSFMQACRTKIFHPWANLIDETLMEQCKQRGWLVYPYCDLKSEKQNPKALWTRLKGLGIDGLCTNFPREFKRWIDDQN